MLMSSSLGVNGQVRDDRWPTNEPKILEVCVNDGGSTKEERDKGKKKGGIYNNEDGFYRLTFVWEKPAECATSWEVNFEIIEEEVKQHFSGVEIKIRKNAQIQQKFMKMLIELLYFITFNISNVKNKQNKTKIKQKTEGKDLIYRLWQ